MATGEFEKLSQADDEREHSIELHLPYIAKVMERCEHQANYYTLLIASFVQSSKAYHQGGDPSEWLQCDLF